MLAIVICAIVRLTIEVNLMRIFKTKHFAKWAKKNLLSDELLKIAAEEISQGFFEAHLGGYILKKRIANKGRGKRGSIRTIVAFKKDSHCFFVYGFEKNEKHNITINEEKVFKLVAKELLSFSDLLLNKHTETNKLLEINNE